MPRLMETEPLAGSAGPRRLRVAPERRAGEPTPIQRGGRAALDRMLQLLERRKLSPVELRVLLAAHDREIAASELAQSFGHRSAEMRRIAARLYARGFLSWRYDRRRDEPMFAITWAGLVAVRPLLTAAARSVPAADGTA